MKSLIAALVAICMLAVPVLATPVPQGTTISALLNAAGQTQYTEMTMIGGTNWQKVGDIYTGGWYIDENQGHIMPTATIFETFSNIGTLTLTKTVYTPGEWNLQESKLASGTGLTMIGKELLWDTNTRSVDANGNLEYPTDLYATINFAKQDGTFTDFENLHNIADKPLAQTWNSFVKTISTDNPYNFFQCVSVNMGPCGQA